MTDIERRMRDALETLPSSSERARADAQRAALEALTPPEPRRRRRWTQGVVVAGATVLVAGAALAATDRLEVRIGQTSVKPPAAAPLTAAPGEVEVPSGALGLAVVVDGRLWLGTRSGLGVQGLAATTAELSPRALYAAVGIGSSLVAMAPNGRKAWSYPAGGEVVGAAWAPNPIVLAYVVRRRERNELHVIEGNGDNDRLVDPDVARVRPSWRADTLALAYVADDGSPRVADYPSLATRPLPGGRRDVSAVAFAPTGEGLALAAASDEGLEVSVGGADWLPLSGPGATLNSLAWTSSGNLVAAGTEPRSGAARRGRVWTLFAARGQVGKASAAGYAAGLEAVVPMDENRFVAAVRVGTQMQLWEIARPEPGRDRPLRAGRIILRIDADDGGIEALSVR